MQSKLTNAVAGLILVWTTLFAVMECHDPVLDKVLVIQDELPQIEVLASYLLQESPLDVIVTDQNALPNDFNNYKAVLLFIHGGITRTTEDRVIEYTKNGGRLVVLHHSISSGKAANPYYFDFLGIQLDSPENSSGPVEPGGGYGWRHQETDNTGVTLTLINLQPAHYITSHKIVWPDSALYQPSDFPSTHKNYPVIQLTNSEVYLNHKFTDGRQKTVILGLKYFDDRVDHLFMQDRAGWIKNQGEGEVIYLMPGHTAQDYKHPVIAQMILNAIQW